MGYRLFGIDSLLLLCCEALSIDFGQQAWIGLIVPPNLLRWFGYHHTIQCGDPDTAKRWW